MTLNRTFCKFAPLAICLALSSGCGEDLSPKIAELEKQLASEKAAFVSASAQLSREKAALAEANSELKKEKAATASISAELSKERTALAVANSDLVKERALLATLNAELTKERAARLEAADKAEAEMRAVADKKAVLTAQLGLTMKSGDTKPVANAKVYLTKRSSSELLSGLQVADNDGKIEKDKALGPQWFWAFGQGKGSIGYSIFAAKAQALVSGDAVAVSDTDFNGTTVFEDVPKGDYYIICATALGGGAVMEKRVSINSAKVKTALSNSDVIQ